jgi:hypothetical protein
MSSETKETFRLIQEAMRSPAEKTELETSSGRKVRIERDPEPGIEIRLTHADAADGEGEWYVLSVAASEARPKPYPSSLPFLPGVEAAVSVTGTMSSVAWRPAQYVESLPPDVKPDPEVAELLDSLGSLREESAQADTGSRRGMAGRAMALFEALSPEAKEKFNEFLELFRPDAGTAAELERLFDAVIESSVNEGWLLQEDKHPEGPLRMRLARLERESATRRLMLTGVVGGGHVMLIQIPATSEE